jgi:hypothetical protein
MAHALHSINGLPELLNVLVEIEHRALLVEAA